MKKLIVTVLTLLSSGLVYALPVGNPSEASLFEQGAWWGLSCCDPCEPCFYWFDAWSIRVGFYGDYVFDRKLELDHAPHKDIEITDMNTNAGYLVLNLCDRVDVFGTLGVTNFHIHSHEQPFQPGPNLGTDLYDIYFDQSFSWSVGARGTLFDWGCFSVGVEGQWFQATPKLQSIDNTRTANHTYPVDTIDTCYREWQGGLGLSYRFCTSCAAFVPYAAVKWSGSKWEMDSFTTLIAGDNFALRDLRSQNLWGYAVGVTLTLCDMAGVTVEGRFGDEKALYVNGQFRF
ncbi:MAG: Major outer membrane porin [Chlamydiales bacterium]|nr:Major outer membrane porin [Chlamydiales bacterium]